MAESQQPVVFLSEGTKRTRGKDAQRINILIAKAVANAVKSTLGPKGMDKMIVDDLGDVTISNDGATILDEISIEHPIGKIMSEVAKTQDDEVGDGTTTAVVIAGGLLKEAEGLLDNDIHPIVLVKGYRLASKKAPKVDFAEFMAVGIVAGRNDKASDARILQAQDEALALVVTYYVIEVAEKRELEDQAYRVKLVKRTDKDVEFREIK